MSNKKIMAVIVFTIVILALASFKMYYVRDDGGVDIVWNKSEGYLFLSVVQRGYRFSYIAYPMIMILGYVGDIRLPDDSHSSITVLHVIPSAVQRYVVKDIPSLTLYTPLDGTIYANREGVLWKWAGARFEQATAEEQLKVDGTNRLSAQAFTDVHGWSSLPSVTSGPPEVTVKMELGGQPLTLLVKHAYNETDISIDLLRHNSAPERIWFLDEQPRRVSRTEYEHTFEKR